MQTIVISLLYMTTFVKTLNDSVTCDFEMGFCGWKSSKTSARQEGVVCGLRRHRIVGCKIKYVYRWMNTHGFGPRFSNRFYSIGKRSANEYDFEYVCKIRPFYRNHILWKIEKGDTKSDGMSAHSSQPYYNGTQLSDLLSDRIPLRLFPRCLKYRFVVKREAVLVVAYTKEKHYDYFELETLAIHGRKNKKDRQTKWDGYNLVQLPIGKTFKVVFRALYQERNEGGEVFVDNIQLTDGRCLAICGPEEYKCKDGGCINASYVCDSSNDCAGKSDEDDCELKEEDEIHIQNCESSTSLRLSSDCRSPIINSSLQRASGFPPYCYEVKNATLINESCKTCQHTVKSFCFVNCPVACSCRGLSFKCFKLHVPEVARSLDVSGVDLQIKYSILNKFMYIVNLILKRCNLSTFLTKNTFRKLQTLNLSENNIKTISGALIRNLVVFIMNGNPLGSDQWINVINNIKLIQIRNVNFLSNFYISTKFDIDLSYSPLSNTNLQFRSVCESLNLSGCSITNQTKADIGCKTLDLSFNMIETYHVHKNTHFLNLKDNQLREFVRPWEKSTSTAINMVNLENNRITKLQSKDLQSFPDLIYINLKRNLITEICNKLFTEQLKLIYLDLSFNKIAHISEKGFAGLSELQFLFLKGNEIQEIDGNLFLTLSKLLLLDMSENGVKAIAPKSFYGLVSLKNMSIHKNKFKFQIRQSLFEGLSSLEYLEVDHYTMCCARPITVRKDRCIAPSNDVSSCDQLIDVPILSVCIWYMALMAVFGNITVLIYRCITWKKTSCKTQAIFTINLSVADFLMGVYLYILAVTNIYYNGVYGFADYKWRHSVTCKLAGVLATLSSESSAFHVFLITVDRVVVIKSGISGRKMTVKMSYILVISAWVISFLIAIVPAFENDYFHSFYANSGVCISLPLSVIRKQGWQYSMAIFIGLNFVLCLGILVGQIVIFIEVFKSGRNMQNQQTRRREIAVAKTLFAIVITDVLCWIPIGVIGLMTFFGVNVSSSIYVWIVIVVLPLNSALNPMLYTLVLVLRKTSSRKQTYTKVKSLSSVTTNGMKKRTPQLHQRSSERVDATATA